MSLACSGSSRAFSATDRVGQVFGKQAVSLGGTYRAFLEEGFQHQAGVADFLERFREAPLESGGLALQQLHLGLAEEPDADIRACAAAQSAPVAAQVPARMPLAAPRLSWHTRLSDGGEVDEIRTVEKHLPAVAAGIRTGGAGQSAVGRHQRVDRLDEAGDMPADAGESVTTREKNNLLNAPAGPAPLVIVHGMAEKRGFLAFEGGPQQQIRVGPSGYGSKRLQVGIRFTPAPCSLQLNTMECSPLE